MRARTSCCAALSVPSVGPQTWFRKKSVSAFLIYENSNSLPKYPMRMRDGLSSRSPESTRGDETVTALYETLFSYFCLCL